MKEWKRLSMVYGSKTARAFLNIPQMYIYMMTGSFPMYIFYKIKKTIRRRNRGSSKIQLVFSKRQRTGYRKVIVTQNRYMIQLNSKDLENIGIDVRKRYVYKIEIDRKTNIMTITFRKDLNIGDKYI